MTGIENFKNILSTKKIEKLFQDIYGEDKGVISYQLWRYDNILDKYKYLFGDNEKLHLISTPGRTEVGGNHTDHNGGRVLAAAVNLDSIAVAGISNDNIVSLYSEGYDNPFVVDIDDCTPKETEKGTTNALIRGIASRLREFGYTVGGFNAYISSDVARGSGLSSSASIEVLIGSIFNHLYNDGRIKPDSLAKIGQYAENRFFGKPCGLMDQLACAVGGFVAIDFKEFDNPIVKKVEFDFAAQNYSLLVVDTGGNHEDLTEEYASIPKEMKTIANYLGGEVCREFNMNTLIDMLVELRGRVSDRSILRAMHFFNDDQRVEKQVKALEENRFYDFLNLVVESGNSSWKWLQNCYTTTNPAEQGITLALAVTENFIAGKGVGAYRVHGGGFAGTIQAFMPNELIEDYVKLMQSIFGNGAIQVLNIRPFGTISINQFLTEG